MTANIRAVVFDFGNVLCPMPQPTEFAALSQLGGIELPKFLESFWRYRLAHDCNTLDGRAYWRQIGAEHRKDFSEEQIVKLIAEDISLWLRLDASMMNWVRDLHGHGVKTGILSNMPRDMATYLRANAAWLNDFDHYVFSGEMGIVKPQAEIYFASLKGLDVRPAEALFIDDNAANIEGARALGIESIKFESVAQLAVDVRRFALPASLLVKTEAE